MATLVYQRVVIPISHGGKGESHHADLGNIAMTWTPKVSMDDFGGRTSSFTYWLFNGSMGPLYSPTSTNRTYMKRFTHVGRQKLGTSWNRMEFSFLINQPLCLVRKSSDPKLNPLWPKWALPEPFCCSRIFQVLGGSHVFFDVSNPTFNSKEYCKIPFFGAAFDSFLVISNPNLLKNWYFCGSKIHCVGTISRIAPNTPATKLRNWVNKESNYQPLPESGYHLE